MTQSQTRSAAGPTFGATFSMSSPRTTMRLSARDDRLRASVIAVADRALSLTIATSAFGRVIKES